MWIDTPSVDNFQAFDHSRRLRWRGRARSRFNRRMDTTTHMNGTHAAGTKNQTATAAAQPGAPVPPATVQRYYSPAVQHRMPAITDERQYQYGLSPQTQAAYGRADPPGPPCRVAVKTGLRNAVVCTAASGGIGLSVIAAVLSRALRERDLDCALMDADFQGGGLDVLLGIENEPGLRFGTIQAPLGRIDGDALNAELPVWDGVRVLAFTPWGGDAPDRWQVQAATRALCESNRVVVVDAGRGSGLDQVPELAESAHMVVAELTVLGLARAKAHIATIRGGRLGGRSDGRSAADSASPGLGEGRPPREGEGNSTLRSVAAGLRPRDGDLLVVGVQPRSAPRNHTGVDVREAEDYLGLPISGPVRASRKLCGDVLNGLGIDSLGKANRAVIEAVADWVETRIAGRRQGGEP